MGRHAWWLAGAVAAAASVVLAIVVPASWWGATFVLGVAATMVALRPVVRPSFAAHWTRSIVIVVSGAVCAGGSYAFAAEPWGPVPQLAWPLGAIFVLGLLATCADAAQTGVLNARGGAYANKVGSYQRRRR